MVHLLLTIHLWDAYISIAWMLLSAAYGLAAHRRHLTHVPSSYNAILLIGGALLMLQGLLGLPLLTLGLRPSSLLHIFIYGALSPLLLPGTYLYTRQQGRNHPNLAFGLVSLFLFAFLVRGVFTA